MAGGVLCMCVHTHKLEESKRAPMWLHMYGYCLVQVNIDCTVFSFHRLDDLICRTSSPLLRYIPTGKPMEMLSVNVVAVGFKRVQAQ